MTKDYSLSVQDSPNKTTDPATLDPNIADRITRMKTVKRRIGGDWQASFFIPLDPKIANTSGYLRQWFNNYIFKTIRQRAEGINTFKGVIWEMNLTIDGVKRTRSMDDIWNAVKTLYLEGGVVTEGTLAEDAISQARYGKRELFLSMGNEWPAASANAQAATMIKDTTAPLPFIKKISRKLKPGLEVVVVGDVFLLNNLFVTTGDGTDTTAGVGEYIKAILDSSTDNEFVRVGRISQSNNLDVPQKTEKQWEVRKRVWDTILELNSLGDASDNPYDVWVDSYGRAHYQQTDSTVRYLWQGTQRGLVSAAGSSNKWAARPGVLRDMTVRGKGTTSGSFLERDNDVLISTITVAENMIDPQLTPENIDDDDIEEAQERYEAWLEEESK